MRRFLLTISVFILSAIACISALAQEVSFAERLAAIPQVKEIRTLESDFFPEKYVLYFEQPIDHNDPSVGTFLQRVFVGNIHPDSATVVVAEGYGAYYADRPRYAEELSQIFNANNVVVEHRYFLESFPFREHLEDQEAVYETTDWSYLTGIQAANDIHCVIEALKEIYTGKWISTGISKGGQNTMIHRAYFPDDVNISVPYVGPLCWSDYDGRHEKFIAEYAGTPEEREAIFNYQVELLLRKEALMPSFNNYCAEKNLKFHLSNEEVYDYCVLEFSFAFWQWGFPVDQIPAKEATNEEVFKYMMAICGPDYFTTWTSTSPFFVQAAKELGYYGYDMKPFKKYKKYFTIKNTKDYQKKLFLPQTQKFEFDDYLYHKINGFLLTTDARILFVYGQFDPWSAVMPADPYKDNIKFYIEPRGSHRARIRTFDAETQEEIIGILSSWLYEK